MSNEIQVDIYSTLKDSHKRYLETPEPEVYTKALYDKLKVFDEEGWALYRAAQKILGVDIYNYFYAEDNMGWFEEADGHKLRKFAEIAKFGECEVVVQGAYEVLSSYTIDKCSEDYKAYLESLYKLASEKVMVGHVDLTQVNEESSDELDDEIER